MIDDNEIEGYVHENNWTLIFFYSSLVGYFLGHLLAFILL